MFSSRVLTRPLRFSANRFCTESVKSPASQPTASSKGSTFAERLSSCLVGIAVGYSVSFYMVYEEIKESNKQLENFQRSVESRLQKLEKK
mmetsp:Transcript_26766/g.39723  ORF Transcript_26766/g.39723 Transcript_26766/m.39723 type:complete len:90 (+) Transcript_26766:50-319(+)